MRVRPTNVTHGNAQEQRLLYLQTPVRLRVKVHVYLLVANEPGKDAKSATRASQRVRIV